MTETVGGRKHSIDMPARTSPKISVWRDATVIVVLAALPGLAALVVFGVVQTPDSPGYVAYAQQILAGRVPSGAALLAEAPAPISLFRTPGYPAVLAALIAAFPGGWRLAAVLLQIGAQAATAGAVFVVGRGMGLGRVRAAAAALLPMIGFAVVVEISLLTDALYSALATGAALLLLRRQVLWAGLFLAAATLLREATPLVALFYVPLAVAAAPRRWLAAALILLPPGAAAAGMMAWNAARIGDALVTTSRQTVMVQAVLPLLKQHLPVYAGDDRFDRTARETVGAGEYGMIDTLHLRLFQQGMTGPQMAAAATAAYWSAWRRFPLSMAAAAVGNFRHEFLAMPFQPIDTLGALMVYAGWARPQFDRLNLLWDRLRGGSIEAVGLIVADVLTRLVGTLITLLAICSVRRREMAGLGLICAGFVLVYLPVHIEPRYLVPVVPVVCLLAAVGSKQSFFEKKGPKNFYSLIL